MFHTQDEIRDSLIEAGVTKAAAGLLAQQARPAVWLKTRRVKDEERIRSGATKLGGRPDLPDGVAWPMRPAWPDAKEHASHWPKPERKTRSRESIREEVEWMASMLPPKQRAAIMANLEETVEATMMNEPKVYQANLEIWKRHVKEEQARQKILRSKQPLSFVAQIDLAEMWAAGPLDADIPRQGLLSIFYDVDVEPWGFNLQDRTGWMILFHDAAAGPLTRRDVPQALQEQSFLPAACTAHACMAPLPINTACYDRLALSSRVTNRVSSWWDENELEDSSDGKNWTCHRIGGWPTPVQGDMQTECALVHAGHGCRDSDAYENPALAPLRASATDWLLLAQIGSDDKAGMMWGDCGQLYLWIRRDDLKARRFENARLTLQCS